MTTSGAQLFIPDFSEWQGAVDWSKVVGGGYPAAIIRVYNGARADLEFQRNRAQAHVHGAKALGLYSFLNPGGTLAIEHQAAAFCSLVGKLLPGEWPIVDYEAKNLHPDMLRTWLHYVGAHLHGAAPWTYTGEYLFRTQHLDGVVPAHRTWLAAYGPYEPREGHELWQYTDHRTVPGVAHPCDCSVFHGNLAQLLAAVGYAPPVTQHPAPHPSRPFPVGLRPDSSTPSARQLQRALKATGWMDTHTPESDNYGPATQRGVAGFNAKHSLNSPGHRYDPAIGPRGWALLMTYAYGAA
jgi:GH25 family lysozyme M1 (1,4-beta-N-acetylmuramidase)